jgi:hypothetical protein
MPLETGRVHSTVQLGGEKDVTSSSAVVRSGTDWPWGRGARASATDARRTPLLAEQSIRRTLILIALYAIPAFVVLRPITDNDIWMNLRAGGWIVAHGAVPMTDPFSSPGEGKRWVAYSWLFEVLVYGLHRWLGLAGIVLFRAAMAYAILAALHHLVARRVPDFVVATSLTGAAFFALVPLLNERTWLFSMLFCTLTLGVILDVRQGAGAGARAGCWLPLIFALWANLHIQFVYGLCLVALACAAPLLDDVWGRVRGAGPADGTGPYEWRRLVVLFGSCVLATLLNPYGAGLYAVVCEYAMQRETFDLVFELLAPAFRMPWEWAMPFLVGAAAYSIGRRRERSTFDLILLAASAFLALRARRDVWLAVLAALAVLSTPGHANRSPEKRIPLDRWRGAAVCLSVVAVLVVAGWRLQVSRKHLDEKVAEVYPSGAAAVVEKRRYPGPLFNEYGWGSYLIWRLPALKVSIDGRADLHGPRRIRRNVDTLAGLRGWELDADLEAAKTVILRVNTALTSLLRLDPRFEQVHEDDVAAVFLRRESTRWCSPGAESARRPRAE